MKKYQDLATLLLRFTLAADFISAVGSRLGIWGKGWGNFLTYTGEVNSFGIKEPLNYSVFADCTAAFLLATLPRYRWSIDEILTQNK